MSLADTYYTRGEKIKKITGSLIQSGLTPQDDLNEILRINLLNFACIVSAVSFLFFGFYVLSASLITGSIICFTNSAFNFSSFILTRKRLNRQGFLLMSLSNLLAYDSLYLLYGQKSGMSFLLLLWLITLVFLSYNRWITVILFASGVFSIVGFDFYFNGSEPVKVLDDRFMYLHYVILVYFLLTLVLVIGFIRNTYHHYQEMLELKNIELSKYFNAIQHTDATVVITDVSGNIEYANPAFEKITGYSAEEAKGRNPRFLKSGQTPPELYREMWSHISNGKVWQGELFNRKKDGSVYIEKATISPVFSPEGVIINYTAIKEDITARISFERALAEIQNKRKLIESEIKIENTERRKLALDLHDHVGPLLSSMNMCLSLLVRNPGLKEYAADIADVRQILKEAITTVREISNNISPHILIHYGLISALRTFFETKSKLVAIHFNSNIQNERLPEIKEMMIYSIIKEAFNNSIKYSECKEIKLDILKNEGIIAIKYADDGIGFNLDEKIGSGSGLGLHSIMNRIKNLEGIYNIETSPGKGFYLEINFPADDEITR